MIKDLSDKTKKDINWIKNDTTLKTKIIKLEE